MYVNIPQTPLYPNKPQTNSMKCPAKLRSQSLTKV